MMWNWAFLIFPVIVAIVAFTVYSWWFGTSWLTGTGVGAVGGALGGLAESFSKLGYVYAAGLAHIGDPAYLGMTLLAIVSLAFLFVVLVINLIPTIRTNPEMLR